MVVGNTPRSPSDQVQSVQRAAALLRLVAAARDGARLVDLAAGSGLHKATALRLLGALERESLIERDPETKRYMLGIEFLAASSAAMQGVLLHDLGRPALRRLAVETGDTVFLSIRSGVESLCVDREEGNFPIKTLTLEIGSRRPLGVGAGSLALLAFLPDPEIKDILKQLTPLLAPYKGYDVAALDALVAETRTLGHACNPGLIISGMQGVAVPVRSRHGHPLAALSVAAINERMLPERRAWIVGLLQEEVQRMEKNLAHHVSPGPSRARSRQV